MGTAPPPLPVSAVSPTTYLLIHASLPVAVQLEPSQKMLLVPVPLALLAAPTVFHQLTVPAAHLFTSSTTLHVSSAAPTLPSSVLETTVYPVQGVRPVKAVPPAAPAVSCLFCYRVLLA